MVKEVFGMRFFLFFGENFDFKRIERNALHEIEKKIKRRIDDAKRLQETGDYQTAERILNSIVILYSDQPFENQVQAANKALQEIKEKRKR